MQLRAYLTETKTSMTSLAALLGVGVSTVHGWASGRRSPSLIVVQRLRDLTGGAVTVDDWVKPPTAAGLDAGINAPAALIVPTPAEKVAA